MEAVFKIRPDEIKLAIIAVIKEKLGVDVSPADADLYVKFDETTKSVSAATLTIKKE